MYKAMYQFKELGTFETLAEAFKTIYDAIKKEKVLLWQMLETAIWIEAPCDVISFYDARDIMCKEGYLVDGKWVDKDELIPAESRYGHEPDKVKPLAQHLGEYLAPLDHSNSYIIGWCDLLKHALDTYESTENVKIKIEKNAR